MLIEVRMSRLWLTRQTDSPMVVALVAPIKVFAHCCAGIRCALLALASLSLDQLIRNGLHSLSLA